MQRRNLKRDVHHVQTQGQRGYRQNMVRRRSRDLQVSQCLASPPPFSSETPTDPFTSTVANPDSAPPNSQVELSVAIIIASTPGFASLMRTHAVGQRLVTSLRSVLGSSGQSHPVSRRSNDRDPNQPRTGRDDHHGQGHGEKSRYLELGEAWLMNSRVTVDIEHAAPPPEAVHTARGVMVRRSVDVERGSWHP